MKAFSRKITVGLQNIGRLSPEKFDLYVYAINAALELLISILCSVIISIWFGMVLESLLFLVIFIPMRSYAGGLHFQKFLICLICSIIVQIIALWVIQNVDMLEYMAAVSILLAVIIIALIGGVDGVRETDNQSYHYFKERLYWILGGIVIISGIILWTGAVYYLKIMSVSLCVVVISLLGGIFKNKCSM